MSYCDGYSGLTIADYFIEKALATGKKITNMHVLKMIFFAQGFGFVQLGRRLIRDDFYAWKFGPVEVNTYRSFKKYGSNPITQPSRFTEYELAGLKSDNQVVKFLDSAFDLINIPAYTLSDITHKSGSPWDMTSPYEVINTDMIRDYFVGAKWKD